MTGCERIGLVVFAHGSRVAAANAAVKRVARKAAGEGGFGLYSAAFLELAEPTLEDAVIALAAAGARCIVVTPYFLTMGLHLTRDFPKILDGIRARHPGLELKAAPPLDGHPALAGILVQRAGEALGFSAERRAESGE